MGGGGVVAGPNWQPWAGPKAAAASDRVRKIVIDGRKKWPSLNDPCTFLPAVELQKILSFQFICFLETFLYSQIAGITVYCKSNLRKSFTSIETFCR